MNVREAMMDSVVARLDLEELGTRFNHYMELKEVFLLGIDVIDRMRPTYISDADRATRIKLTSAVEMINKRLDYLSDFSDKSISLAREVRAAGIHRPLQLMEVNPDAKPQDPNPASDTKAPGDSPK
jgi:hypothetical protein